MCVTYISFLECARDEDENEIPGKIFDCDEKGNYKIVACAGYIC